MIELVIRVIFSIGLAALAILWGWMLRIGLRVLLPINLQNFKAETCLCIQMICVCIVSFCAMITSGIAAVISALVIFL